MEWRIRAWTVFVAGSLLCLALMPTPRILAQDAKEAAKAEPAPASSEGSAAPKPRSMLRWALEASGPIGIFLLCLSVYSKVAPSGPHRTNRSLFSR